MVVPHHKDKALIGTPGVELKFGTGLTRGFRWGAVTARGAVEYSSAASRHFDSGEYAVEYLKRLSPRFRFYAGIEGKQDELSAIAGLQWHVSRGRRHRRGHHPALHGVPQRAADDRG